MNEDSLISVILPTYNRADTLGRAIDSVLAQTHTQWELIIWDDGSSDHTDGIISSYDDSRIHYYQGSNHGVAYARNRAVEKASGKFLAFLDSDDTWVESKLDFQIRALKAHPNIDVFFGNFVNIHIGQARQQQGFEQNKQAMKFLDIEKINHDIVFIHGGLLRSIAIDNYIATDTVIMHTDTYERLGGFNEALKNSEDFNLWWRLGLTGHTFAYTRNILLTRYKPPKSLSSHSREAYKNRILALDLCVKEAEEKGKKGLSRSLKSQYRNVWQNLIVLHGIDRNKKAMINAFYHSLKYGIRTGSLRLLISGLLEPLNTQSGKQ